MKRVQYAGGEFVTCDHVAEELVEFGVALANQGRAASVEVPMPSADGSKSTVTVLLGPASQLVVLPEDADDLDCSEAVEQIRAARAELLREPSYTQIDLATSSLDWP